MNKIIILCGILRCTACFALAADPFHYFQAGIEGKHHTAGGKADIKVHPFPRRESRS